MLPKPAGSEASANGIDDAGNVIGTVGLDSAEGVRIEARLWDAAGQSVVLPPVASGAWASPVSIRNGRVLGTEFGGRDAGIVVWDLSGAVQWHLGPRYGANAINADGLVTGWQGVPDGLIQRLFQNGQAVATPPVGFSAGASGSALTDAGVLAGTSDNQAAVATCR